MGAVPPREFREALSLWASGVTVVAVREEGRVYATTVTSFLSVSSEPPRILVSLGPGAQPVPFLRPGAKFVVNLLEAGQGRLASVFADPFPVGPTPFPAEGDPWLPGALACLLCATEQVIPLGGIHLVLGLVEDARFDTEGRPLLRFRRSYLGLP